MGEKNLLFIVINYKVYFISSFQLNIPFNIFRGVSQIKHFLCSSSQLAGPSAMTDCKGWAVEKMCVWTKRQLDQAKSAVRRLGGRPSPVQWFVLHLLRTWPWARHSGGGEVSNSSSSPVFPPSESSNSYDLLTFSTILWHKQASFLAFKDG